MGADGGLTWIVVKEPSQLDRINALTSPFIFAPEWRSEDYEWLKSNPFKESVIFGKYGTDILTDELQDLVDMVREPFEHDHYTFAEVAEDLLTRPYYELYNLTSVEEAVLKCCNYNSWFKYKFDRSVFNPIKLQLNISNLAFLSYMIIFSWKEEIKNLLQIERRVNRVETWT